MGCDCAVRRDRRPGRFAPGAGGRLRRPATRSARASARSRASCPTATSRALNRGAGCLGRGGPAHGRRDPRPRSPRGPPRTGATTRRSCPPSRPPATTGRSSSSTARAAARRRRLAPGRARWRSRTAACASAPGTAIDLGGIAKGWSADRALEAMRDAWPGLPGGLVDLGGDLALWGRTPEGGPWRVARRRPAPCPARAWRRSSLDGGGVATSGRDRRRFGPGGSLHHLIDPATGEPRPRAGPLAVTVVGPRARTAPRRSRRCWRSATSRAAGRPWPRTPTSRRSSCPTPASPSSWARRASSGRPSP